MLSKLPKKIIGCSNIQFNLLQLKNGSVELWILEQTIRIIETFECKIGRPLRRRPGHLHQQGARAGSPSIARDTPHHFQGENEIYCFKEKIFVKMIFLLNRLRGLRRTTGS